MTFRSEVLALRARADAAERELAIRRSHLERLEVTEARLADASRIVRESLRAASRPPPALPAVIGVLVGAGITAALALAIAWSSPRYGVFDRTSELEARTDDAEMRLALAETQAIEATASVDRLHRELSVWVRLFPIFPVTDGHPAFPHRLPSVTAVRGPVSVRAGDACWLTHTSDRACSAAIRCGDVLVHGLGCVHAPTTVEDMHVGTVSFTDTAAGWTVWVRADAAPVGSTLAAR